MFEPIFAVLASTAFIYSALSIFIVLMAILLENEREGWATTVFSLAIALLLWNFKTDIWVFVASKPTATIGFAISYIVAGILWSFLKWRTYVKKVFSRFKELRLEFVAKNGPISAENIRTFTNLVENNRFKDSDGYSMSNLNGYSVEAIVNKLTPLASQKKSVITAWISYWPVSLAATFLNNPFKQFFNWIYSMLSGYYDKITNILKKDAIGT